MPLRNDHSATNFILSQTPGKLPLKDLFAFIKEQREAAEARRKKARAGCSASGGVHGKRSTRSS